MFIFSPEKVIFERLSYVLIFIFTQISDTMRNISLFCLLYIPLFSFSQKSLNDIDLSLIPQRKICAFIEQQKESQVLLFKEVEASCKWIKDFSDFCFTESSYIIKEELSYVWNQYLFVSPSVSWDGKMISFGLLFSKETDSILYRSENSYSGLDTGQIIYVNLKMMAGLYNLAVGFEITHIDYAKKQIESSYLVGGKAKGVQTIQFYETDSGITKMVHQTYFKSRSHIRDRFFYPKYHRKAINEFHRNVLNELLVEEEIQKKKKIHKKAVLQKPTI